MASHIGRRKFLATLGGAAAAWPLAARAQQAAMPVIGFLVSASAEGYASVLVPVREALNEAGYSEGQNLSIEYRWADYHYDRLPALAADLIRRQVAVIYATGSVVSAIAAKSATSAIPIVFLHGSDPVRYGLVASLNRPGGNVTGVTLYNSALGPKRIELLRDLVPKATTIGLLVNPTNPNAADDSKEIQEASVGGAIYDDDRHEHDPRAVSRQRARANRSSRRTGAGRFRPLACLDRVRQGGQAARACGVHGHALARAAGRSDRERIRAGL
jgi:putative tryptophan/tyrosine transport system substrate-binding protein